MLDQARERHYETLLSLVYFDSADDNPYQALSWSDVSTPEAQKFARQSAADIIVLLKNNGT
jgi:beta-D-xylosidase 4